MTIESFYNGSILAGAVTTAVLALCLILVKPPRQKAFDVYRRSKIMLGLGYAVYAIGISVFVIWPLRFTIPRVGTAVNLTYYFAAAFLFGCSFISLISPDFCSGSRLRRYALTYLAYVASLWTVTLTIGDDLLHVALIGFGIWFVIQALILIRVFLKSYRRLRRELDNNYADSTATFIEWLNNSAWCVIVFGITCGVSAFLSHLFIAILMTLGIFVFIYIYVSMQNYVLHLTSVQYVAEHPVIIPPQAPREIQNEAFVAKLDHWISSRGYCCEGTTLDRLAVEVGTNRSYLSSYINTRYRMSFSEWINDMRISHAKELMTLHPGMSVEDVASQCGYSTASYFSRRFKACEGVAPSLWTCK